jgi:hypothetical protein
MEIKTSDITYASRLNQRAIEFYNAARNLRKNFFSAVHVIDYCTALSFELKAKAIICLDGQFNKKLKIHKICELFEKCGLDVNKYQYRAHINFYEHILNKNGRYSIKDNAEREKHNRVLAEIGIEIERDHKHYNNMKFKINPEKYAINHLYKDIWKELCEIYERKIVDVHNQKNTV